MVIPSWAIKYKKKGIEIREINGNYYAYKYTSIWDKEKKRPKRITQEYLGTVTPDGIIPPKHKREIKIDSLLEYGNIKLVEYFSADVSKLLKKYFPYIYESIISSAIIRLIYNSPLKNLSFYYTTTYLKKLYPRATLSPNKISKIIKQIGLDYGSMLSFFRELNKGKDHIAIDLTHIFSESENIGWLERGYNSKGTYHNQLQLLLIYSLDRKVPSFFKLLPGSIRDVSSLVNAIYESRLTNVVLVTDKGFYSKENVNFLDESELFYVIPLKRNSSLIRYYTEKSFDNYFKFRDRFIWHKEYKLGKRRIILCLDKKLRAEEETTFLSLVESGKRTIQEYKLKRKWFGTIAFITNTNLTPEEVYILFKNRIEIECAYDSLKNALEGDKTYMRNNESMRGFFFICFISLYLYCKILNHLVKKNISTKYSVNDVFVYLSKIYKANIGDKEITSEAPKKVKTLIKKLEIPIT